MRQSKESIIKAYRDLVARNDGKLIGARVFERESGVPKYAWNGGYWRNWAAFQVDMGYTPNSPTQRTDVAEVIGSALENGTIGVSGRYGGELWLRDAEMSAWRVAVASRREFETAQERGQFFEAWRDA